MKKGGCASSNSDRIASAEKRNQIAAGKAYFHTFGYKDYIAALPKSKYLFEHSYWSWLALKHNPYIPIFKEKILRTAETGLNKKFWNEAIPFKLTEEEPIEALKLEHFYIMLIGNAIGLALSLGIFFMEMIIVRKKGRKMVAASPPGISKPTQIVSAHASEL